jgi:hydroxyacylglutathione hydrolase
MALKVTTIHAFSDNYIWLIHDTENPARVVVVDPGDAAPVLKTLADQELELIAVLITHHHPDHVGGIEQLLAHHEVPVFGPANEHIPCINFGMVHGQRIQIPETGLNFEVIEVPGHTLGHIAYYGGRLFEGTAAQMTASMDELAELPPETAVYCAHEYTLSNLRFALAADPDNQALRDYQRACQALRDAGQPTIPSTIGTELAINPFLRCAETDIKRAAESRMERPPKTKEEVFAAIRLWKDSFA